MNKLSVCIDLRSLQIGHEKRGIGMVVKSFLENLEESKHKYIFYTYDKNNPIKDLKIDIPKNVEYEILKTPYIHQSIKRVPDFFKAFRIWKHKFSSLKNMHPDVFIQFDIKLGKPRWKNVKSVAFAYDLIPLIFRNDYLPSMSYTWKHNGKNIKQKIKPFLRSIYYNYSYKYQCNNYFKYDKLISISEHTKESFISYLGYPKDKIITIPLAPVIKKDAKPKTIKLLENYDFVFYIGGTDKRKHVDEVIYTYNIARGRGLDAKLVLVGNEFRSLSTIPDRATSEAIHKSPYLEDIATLGFVSDDEKMWIYANAKAFILTSHFEGFGLPIIESQLLGCPFVAYNNSSLTEVTQNMDSLVETGKYNLLANELIRITKLPRLKKVSTDQKFAKQYSWSKFSYDLLTEVDKLAAESRH